MESLLSLFDVKGVDQYKSYSHIYDHSFIIQMVLDFAFCAETYQLIGSIIEHVLNKSVQTKLIKSYESKFGVVFHFDINALYDDNSFENGDFRIVVDEEDIDGEITDHNKKLFSCNLLAEKYCSWPPESRHGIRGCLEIPIYCPKDSKGLRIVLSEYFDFISRGLYICQKSIKPIMTDKCHGCNLLAYKAKRQKL